MEVDIDILKNGQGGFPVTDFEAKFCKVIVENFLRKFCFHFALNTSDHFLRRQNTAHPGDQAFEFEQMNETKSTLLKRLMLKTRQRARNFVGN